MIAWSASCFVSDHPIQLGQLPHPGSSLAVPNPYRKLIVCSLEIAMRVQVAHENLKFVLQKDIADSLIPD